jgi:hypothetical protein
LEASEPRPEEDGGKPVLYQPRHAAHRVSVPRKTHGQAISVAPRRHGRHAANDNPPDELFGAQAAAIPQSDRQAGAQTERPPVLQKNEPDPRTAEDVRREKQLAGLKALLALATATVEAQATPAPLLAPETPPRILALFKDPALRGAFALMLSAGAAGILAFSFWAVNAHHYSASAVGSVSAEVSSITFLATVGSLNMTGLFARFLPVAGWHTRRLIITGYGAAALAGLLAAAVFLLTPFGTDIAVGGRSGRVAFAVFVVLNSIFNIQDGGLIGFGRFGWVPIENVLVASARLAILPLAASLMSARSGVLWSWAIPMAAAVLVVNSLIIGPLAGRQTERRPVLPTAGDLCRFVALDSVSSAIYAAVASFLPALVTHRLGAVQGGYFYVPWVITTMVSLVLTNISISMVRETVANPSKADSTIPRSFGLILVVVVLVMTVCLLLPHLLLAPLGLNFADHGAPLLHWVGLTVPATAIIVAFWAVCLVQRRPVPVFALNLATSGAVICGVLLIGSGSNIGRVGMIYCVVQWAAAIVVAFPTLAELRAIRHDQGTR